MFESFILGAVQGIAEWLPVSSEAMIVLVKSNFFPDNGDITSYIQLAIFLHIGTLLAALVYFRKKIWKLLQQFFSYSSQTKDVQDYLSFIVIATLVSGIIGYILLEVVKKYQAFFEQQSLLNAIVAIFLFITALLLYISENRKNKEKVAVSKYSSYIVGIFQGCSAIPGISRSGSTIAAMGLLGYEKVWALEMSFILSIPLVFFANIILNYEMFMNITTNHLIAIASSFLFGILTISILLNVVKRIRFSYFVGFFALLVLTSSFFI